MEIDHRSSLSFSPQRLDGFILWISKITCILRWISVTALVFACINHDVSDCSRGDRMQNPRNRSCTLVTIPCRSPLVTTNLFVSKVLTRSEGRESGKPKHQCPASEQLVPLLPTFASCLVVTIVL